MSGASQEALTDLPDEGVAADVFRDAAKVHAFAALEPHRHKLLRSPQTAHNTWTTPPVSLSHVFSRRCAAADLGGLERRLRMCTPVPAHVAHPVARLVQQPVCVRIGASCALPGKPAFDGLHPPRRLHHLLHNPTATQNCMSAEKTASSGIRGPCT